MATIDISSIVQYYNTGNGVGSGTATVSGYTTSDGAKRAAQTAAQTAANSIGGGTPNSGGSSSSNDRKFGKVHGRVTSSIGTPRATASSSGTGFDGSCSWSATRISTIYQLKLKFTLPSGVTTSNLSTATLSFSATNNNTTSQTYRVCAPKSTTEQTTYEKYGSTTTVDTATYKEFSSPTNTNSKAFEIDIKDIFKKCITNNQGWITILIPSATASDGDRYMTITGTPTITYTTSYTKCGAPTNISFTSIVKPGGSLTISWSGASAGTNNTITGYDVYYKIGTAPTTSSYDGTASVSSTNTSASQTFTISSSADIRDKIFYAIVRTKGNAGSSYYSDWKSGNGGKVNSLPGAPSITDITATRLKSTGGTVTFTISPGTDSNTGQTLSVWYNTDNTSWSGSNCKEVPSNGKLKTPTLTATTTYYFKTWDGLEYSSSYASKTIKVNTPPTIGSITMSAYNNTTYSPSVRDGYVKNINGSATNVTKDSAATSLTYQWKLQVGSGTSATSYGTTTNISTATSLSNIDVTSYGANFNTAYRLALTVTDDLGESATAYSSKVFAIPAVPAISSIINTKGSSDVSNTNSFHFNNGIRIYYDKDNNGLTRILEYYTDYKDWPTKPSSVSLSYSNSDATYYSDATVSSLNRGTTYHFRIKYSFGNISTYGIINSSYYYDSSHSNVTKSYMRAKDITPTSLTITPQSGSVIKPYTQSLLNFTFTNSPKSWTTSQDVATTYSGIYSIKLKYSTRSLAVSSSGTNSSGTVTGTVTLSSISTTNWKTLLGLSNAPNTSYTITLEVTATNGFGSTFTATKTFTANFIEGIFTIGTPELRIKTGTSTYTKIPDSYNNLTTTARYHIFEGQTLQFALSGLKCYANQKATIYFMNGNTSLGSIAVTASDWTESNVSGTNYRWTLSSTKTIDYSVPSNTTASYDSNVRNYSVKVVLDNGSSKLSTDSGESNGNLNTCFHTRFAPSSINFKITKVTESNWTWSCTDWGSLNSSTKYSADYSSVKVQLRTSTNGTSGYSNLGNQQTLTASSGSGTITQSLDNVNGDVLYFGVIISIVLKFQTIDDNGTTRTPTGTTSYPYTYNNLYTLYRATPNILYGKNFFVMNGTTPRNDENLLLEIKSAGYRSGNTDVTRNMIYIGEGTLEITTDGLVIDCGSW